MNASMVNTMFSKASDEWRTPRDFYQKLTDEFCFRVDTAATAENAQCFDYFGLDDGKGCHGNALTQPWFPSMPHWCNPPYSLCKEFAAKAAQERRRGVLTVMLIPARTDTRYFHTHVWDETKNQPREGIELRFVKGRLRFEGGKHCAPFPSLVVVYRPEGS